MVLCIIVNARVQSQPAIMRTAITFSASHPPPLSDSRKPLNAGVSDLGRRRGEFQEEVGQPVTLASIARLEKLGRPVFSLCQNEALFYLGDLHNLITFFITNI